MSRIVLDHMKDMVGNSKTNAEFPHIIDAEETSKFIQQSLYNFNCGEELAWAWNARENIILYGRGGYGKSDAASMFHEYLKKQGVVTKEKPFVMSLGQGTTEETLLGGIDLKKFQEEGEIIYLLRNAFVEHEVVILEEMFDATKILKK